MKNKIYYIKRENLNVAKYDACIQSAVNSRIYAYSWYLDIVTTNWDVLVLDDYHAVMPLPWRCKFFIKYVYVPVWTQQLGVFFRQTINEEIILNFLKKIPSKFRKITIYLNDSNKINSSNISIRNNFILDLQNSFEHIYNGFSKNRKQSLKKSIKPIIKQHYNHQRLYPYFRNYIIEKSGIEEQDLLLLDKLLAVCYKKDKAFVIEAQDNKGDYLGGAIFLIDNNRIYYLFSALSDKGRSTQAMSHIVSYIIHKYEGTDYILDFEGSMLPGIASFFKSFGSINNEYYQFQRSFFLL